MLSRLASTSILSVFVVCGVLIAQESQEATAKAAKASPVGTWKWERDFNGSVVKFTLLLKHEDEKLSGTFKSQWPEGGPPGFSDPVEISDAKIEGDAVTFAVKREFNGNEFVVHFSGKIDGDKVVGSQKFETPNGPQEVEWNATRFFDYSSVVGTWKFKFQGPNGDAIEPKVVFSMDGSQVKGVYHSTFFGENEIEKIALNDDKLTFEVTFDTDQGSFTLNYKAEPKGDKISGSISGSAGGQDFDMQFEGTRQSTDGGEVKNE